MANELDTLSAGEIQPYNEGMPVLAPLSPAPDTWGTNREIDDYQRQPQGPTLFGAALPAGTSRQQVDVVLGQLSGAFMNDMSTLGYPAHMVQASIQVLTANATKAPYQVTPKHNFNLHGQDDWLGHLFGNAIYELSGSPRAKQSFVTAAITWLAKATKQLNSGSASTSAHGSAPSNAGSSEAMLAKLSEDDYDKVVAVNQWAQTNSLNTLANKHGEHMARSMVELAQKQLESLSPNERAHFDQFTTVNGVNWIHLMNCVETIEFLYNSHIGAASIGTSSGDINKEIAQFENMLADPVGRRKYFKDSQLQARYRTLLDMRDGG
jgi:hypothetical protein